MASHSSSSLASDSPEYSAIRECTSSLVSQLQYSIGSLGDALYAKKIMPRDVWESIIQEGNKVKATREVVSYVATKVEHNPSIYHQFLDILNDLQFKDVVDQLRACYKTHCVAHQLSTTTLNESTEPLKYKKEISVPLDVPSGVLAALISVHVSVVHQDQNESRTLVESPSRVERDNKATSSEVPWSDSDGMVMYAAAGSRDVLIIVSDVAASDSVVPRRTRESLTQEEIAKLEEQGIHKEYCANDLCIIRARYDMDRRCNIVDVLRAEQLSCDQFKTRLTDLMNTSTKEGVILRYMGPGQTKTGNWCFKDGFVSFEELMSIYSQHFKSCVLTVLADCSHSGNWVKQAMAYMGQQGVGPCGHSAKEKGILVKVIASCLANEIPIQLAFSTHCTTYYKDREVMTFSNLNLTYFQQDLPSIHTDQHAIGVDFTRVRCNNTLIDEPCTMAPGSTWEQWNIGRRICLVRGEDRGQLAWYYVRLADSEDNARAFYEKVKSGSVNPADYGEILKRGWGKDPPEEVKDEIRKKYFVNYNHCP